MAGVTGLAGARDVYEGMKREIARDIEREMFYGAGDPEPTHAVRVGDVRWSWRRTEAGVHVKSSAVIPWSATTVIRSSSSFRAVREGENDVTIPYEVLHQIMVEDAERADV